MLNDHGLRLISEMSRACSKTWSAVGWCARRFEVSRKEADRMDISDAVLTA